MSDLVTLATPMADGLLCWFAEATLVGLALAALAALCARSRRLALGPAARHALWFIVLLKLAAPPLVQWPWSVPSPAASVRPAGEIPRTLVEVGALGPGPGSEVERSPDSGPIEPSGPSGALPVVAEEVFDDELGGRLDRGDDFAPTLISRGLGTWVVLAWLVGSVAIGACQGARVVRFRRLLGEATPAPSWLAEEAERVGRRLGVRVPPILVVPRLGTPLLWCLGRPLLLVPGGPLKALEAGCWRAIVAHELAHLRRGDHWVRRLELVAGLAWWWNPLYWWARRRLDFEAELACDAWAVWASPEDRLSYAESLFRICANLSSAKSPAPALGIAGNGRSFERRLKMILQGRVDRRLSATGLLGVLSLAALALPSWTTFAGPDDEKKAPDGTVTVKVAPAASPKPRLAFEVEVIEDDKPADDKERAAKPKASKTKPQQTPKAIAKEIEAKFGPGSEFLTKMEAFAREMEAKFGPGSDFAKETGAQFGFDMDVKVMESPANESEEDQEARIAKMMASAQAAAKVKAKKMIAEMKARMDAAKPEEKAKPEARVKPKAEPGKRDRRIEALESRINELMKELKQLKDDEDSDEEADRP